MAPLKIKSFLSQSCGNPVELRHPHCHQRQIHQFHWTFRHPQRLQTTSHLMFCSIKSSSQKPKTKMKMNSITPQISRWSHSTARRWKDSKISFFLKSWIHTQYRYKWRLNLKWRTRKAVVAIHRHLELQT